MRLDANRDPYLYQQSTYAPDDHYRWMGSPNIDRKGDIALAYSYGGGPYVLPIATTMSAASVVGATNIKVAAVTGTNVNFAVGGKINIGTGATLETATVAAIGTAGAGGTGIDLTAPLTIAHASALDRLERRVRLYPAGLRAGRTALHGAAAGRPARTDDLPGRRDRRGHRRGRRLPLGGLVEARRSTRPTTARSGTSAATASRAERAGRSSAAPARSACRPAASTRLGAAAAAIPSHYSGSVASFTDSDLTATAADFSAGIDWGDGTTSAGVVTGANGSFGVSGRTRTPEPGRHDHDVDRGHGRQHRPRLRPMSSSTTIPAGGATFVIGDGSATGSVTFWSPQWAKKNVLSQGSTFAVIQGLRDEPGDAHVRLGVEDEPRPRSSCRRRRCRTTRRSS